MRTRRRIRPQTLEQLVERVRGEFAALPGLRLTEEQVRRVWGLEPALSSHVLRALVECDYLQLTTGGEYVRVQSSWRPPAGMAIASSH